MQRSSVAPVLQGFGSYGAYEAGTLDTSEDSKLPPISYASIDMWFSEDVRDAQYKFWRLLEDSDQLECHVNYPMALFGWFENMMANADRDGQVLILSTGFKLAEMSGRNVADGMCAGAFERVDVGCGDSWIGKIQ
ncbi:hypothetical protein shim_30840 [Shimia sp. SK013]|nr:hypothetical protein shim_30840 [Shimia sp. SK013]